MSDKIEQIIKNTTSKRQFLFPKLINELKYKKNLIIGGKSNDFISSIIKQCPNTIVYCIDDWLYGKNIDENYKIYYKNTEEIVDFCRNGKMISMVEDIPKALSGFQNNYIDFLHIDKINNFSEILKLSLPKVRVNGILSGYNYNRNANVKVNIIEFCKLNKYNLKYCGGVGGNWWFIKEK